MPTAAALGPMPSRDDKVAYGEYMTNAAVCADCHTPMDDRARRCRAATSQVASSSSCPAVAIVRPANITPDADSGIGTWTEQQFIDKFKALEAAEPRALTDAEQRENTIMPWMYYARHDPGGPRRHLRISAQPQARPQPGQEIQLSL